MSEKGYGRSLKYRLIFYVCGVIFATSSYLLLIWTYGMESASWGDVDLQRKLLSNMLGAFETHRVSFFTWELICMGIALAVGHLMDREVHYRKLAEQQANIDGLTGIYNHRFFQERLALEIERATRYGRHLSLIMLDIDDFKQFNDTWGHQEGDKLLKWFAEVCGRCIRNIDVLARYGGEEFVIILPETKSDEAFTVADRIRQNVQTQAPAFFGRNRAVTISAGIASLPEHGATRHSLILNADAALYYAKQCGKNRCYIYEERHQRSYRATSHVAPLLYDDYIDAIEALSSVIDARDAHRESHSHTVTETALLLGEKIGMSAEEIANLRVAALLHDIGSVVTPSDVLSKSGPLTAADWQAIESHAQIGSSLIKRMQEMAAIVPGIKHHHERYDGTGYPSGLVGKNIPLLARIIAIADAYDAMTSPRAYHKPMSREQALQEIKNCAGKQFDPELVDAFVEAMSQKEDSSPKSQAA